MRALSLFLVSLCLRGQSSSGQRIKKLPEKPASQGGRGRDTFPGAIGRVLRLRAQAERSSVSGLVRLGVSPSGARLPCRAGRCEGRLESCLRADPTTWFLKCVVFRRNRFDSLTAATGEKELSFVG